MTLHSLTDPDAQTLALSSTGTNKPMRGLGASPLSLSPPLPVLLLLLLSYQTHAHTRTPPHNSTRTHSRTLHRLSLQSSLQKKLHWILTPSVSMGSACFSRDVCLFILLMNTCRVMGNVGPAGESHPLFLSVSLFVVNLSALFFIGLGFAGLRGNVMDPPVEKRGLM